jgi:fatty acid desaturase
MGVRLSSEAKAANLASLLDTARLLASLEASLLAALASLLAALASLLAALDKVPQIVLLKKQGRLMRGNAVLTHHTNHDFPKRSTTTVWS